MIPMPTTAQAAHVANNPAYPFINNWWLHHHTVYHCLLIHFDAQSECTLIKVNEIISCRLLLRCIQLLHLAPLGVALVASSGQFYRLKSLWSSECAAWSRTCKKIIIACDEWRVGISGNSFEYTSWYVRWRRSKCSANTSRRLQDQSVLWEGKRPLASRWLIDWQPKAAVSS
jgi:hypothetical protein